MASAHQRVGTTRSNSQRRMEAGLVGKEALRQIADLTGRPADTVSAIERTDSGWRVEVELVELERVPSTTNILATYDVELDDQGTLLGYRRVRRYYRNAAEERSL